MAKKKQNRDQRLIRQLRIRTSAAVLTMLLIAGAGGKWMLDTFGGEIKSMFDYDNLRDKVSVEMPFDREDFHKDEGASKETESTEAPEDIEVTYPTIIQDNEEEVITSKLLDDGYEFNPVDFNSLKQINEDTVAWISIDGTKIDFPIVQGETNDEYLKTDFNGNHSSMGSIFLDYRNNSLENPTYDLSDFSLIYGHHMTGGRMFAQLCNYKSQSYYDNHKTGIIYTTDGLAHEIEFFAGVIIDGRDETVLFTSDFVDEDHYDAYVSNIRRNSTFESDVEVEYGDKVVALVTCTYETDNSRYVLYGVINKQIINENQRDLVTPSLSK